MFVDESDCNNRYVRPFLCIIDQTCLLMSFQLGSSQDWDTPYANAVTKATNEYRQSQGLEPLTLDSWVCVISVVRTLFRVVDKR